MSEGEIEIHDQVNQEQDIEDISRDTSSANNPLDKIFDREKILERQEAASMFGEMAFDMIGTWANSERNKYLDLAAKETDQDKRKTYEREAAKWGEGGEYKLLLHGLAGGIMAEINNGDFGEGVKVGVVNELLLGFFTKNMDLDKDDKKTMESISNKIGELLGGHAGGAIAESSTKNNLFEHYEEMLKGDAKEAFLQAVKKCKTDEELYTLGENYLTYLLLSNGLTAKDGYIYKPVVWTYPDGTKAVVIAKVQLSEDGSFAKDDKGNTYVLDNNNNLVPKTIDWNAFENSKEYFDLTPENIKNSPLLDIGKDIAIGYVDGTAGKIIADTIKDTFTISKIPAPSIGPAGEVMVKVNTTSTGSIILKNVSKVGGLTIVSTAYDVYVDYQDFGGFNEKFAEASAIDISKNIVAIGGGALAINLGAPVFAVALIGGGVMYFVNTNFIEPYKEDLKKIKNII